MRVAKYSNFKKSEIEWISEVPDHWKKTKTAFEYEIQLGKMLQPQSLAPDEFLCTYYKAINVQWENIVDDDLSEMWVNENESNKFRIDIGDLLVCEGGEVGRASLVKSITEGSIIQNSVHRVRPKNGNDLRFLMYILRYAAAQKWLEILCNKATIAHFTVEKFKNLKIALPPVPEQINISDFLDREIARIDALIEKKKAFIEKLNEKRTALIHQAVTKGLNPKVKLKESGIEWIGLTPEHWQIWKISHGYNCIGSGTTPKTDEYDYYEGDIPWVTTSELRENIIVETKKKISRKAQEDFSALKMYPEGTLLIAMYGATIGRLGILGVAATVNQACCAFAEPTVFKSRFIFYWLLVFRPVLISFSSGGGQPNLNQELLKQIKVSIPEIEEQSVISDYLDDETLKIDNLVLEVEKAIEKLKEYRITLITSAVTGKINVSS